MKPPLAEASQSSIPRTMTSQRWGGLEAQDHVCYYAVGYTHKEGDADGRETVHSLACIPSASRPVLWRLRRRLAHNRSDFINSATGRPMPPSDPNKLTLEPNTVEVEAIPYELLTRESEIIFIDTPELQKYRRQPIQPIATYEGTFKALAGEDWARKTVGVTSMWPLDDQPEGQFRARHAELARLWKAAGMKEARFSKVTQDEAWQIIDLLLDNPITHRPFVA
ncbi:hypothetical protein IMY05_C4546000600 [Salix suchowensis]|nr:hypothetical protein IMY05_C4546000600 [Salix suchowensis]